MITPSTPSDLIRSYLANGQTEEALKEALALLKDSSVYETIILAAGKFKQLMSDISQSLIGPEEQNVTRNQITSSLLGALSAWDLSQELGKTAEDLKRTEKEHLRQLLKHLKRSYDVHRAQLSLGFWLMSRVKARMKVGSRIDIDDFFFSFYDHFTEEEARIHREIRAYTGGILYVSNTRALDILQKQSHIYEWGVSIPLIEELENHLLFWKTKFEVTFEEDPKVCLVYTTRKEKMGFPKGVEKHILAYLDGLAAEKKNMERDIDEATLPKGYRSPHEDDLEAPGDPLAPRDPQMGWDHPQ
ncbi:MAG: hypothetical protein AAF694_00425 [Bacteroidota bacterium]